MKKKILCLAFALAMLLSLASCGGKTQDAANNSTDKGTDDFSAFMEVQKNMSSVKDMEYKMKMDMKIPDQDGANMTMNGTGKEIMKSKDDIQMEINYNINTAGTEMKGLMYMKDQALYMDMMGQKVKVDAKNEMASMMNIDTANLFAITKEMISDLSVTKKGDDTVYSFKMDVNKALDYFKKNAGGAGKLTNSQTGDVTFNKMDITIVAGQDKMAKSIDMDCSMVAKSDDQTVNMDYKLTMEYLSFNTDLKINFPDFKEYQEIAS